MSIENFDDLFVHLARDTYNAEKQLTKALPKLARSAANDELRQCFEQHLEETEQQVERLEQIFEMMGQNPKGMKCEAAEGLVQEAQEIMGEIDDEQVRDAGLIAAAQAFEHYEIARYGTLVAWAQKMGQREVVRLLQQTLREEHNANNLLNQLAEQTINEEAIEASDEEGEEDEERSGNGHRRQEMSSRSQGRSSGNGGRSQGGRQQSGGRGSSGRGQEQSRGRQQASRGR